MTIDTNELRRKLSSVDIVDHIGIHANVKSTLTELLDRIEDAEKDIALKERVIDSLGAELNDIANERDDLLAKIEAMEKQEPGAWCATDETGTVIEALGMNQSRRFDTALYLAPGAKGGQK